MKYRANPVEVDAYKITFVGGLVAGARFLRLENGQGAIADAGMMARMTPVEGDYLVIQSDGYKYLNPKDVFERKYSPVELNALELGAAVRREGLAGQ